MIGKIILGIIICIVLIFASALLFKEEPIYTEGQSVYEVCFSIEDHTLWEYPLDGIDITLNHLYNDHDENWLGVNLLLRETTFQEIDHFEFESGVIQIGEQNIILNKDITIWMTEKSNMIRLVQDTNNMEIIEKIIENEDNTKVILLLKFKITINEKLINYDINETYDINIKEHKYLKNINPNFPNIFNYLYWIITFATV